MPWIQQPSVCLWMLCAASKSTECYGLARHVALSLSYAGINQIEMKPIVSLDTRSTISVSRTFLILFVSTSSSRASRGRKFQKKKELYSKERICL